VPAPFDREPLVAGALTLVLAAGAILAVRRGGVARVAASVAAILLCVVLVATSTSAINAPTGRYLAPALPFVVLAAVAGLAGADPAGGRRVLVTGLVAVLALAAGLESLGTPGPRRARGAPDAVAASRADRAVLGHLAGHAGGPVLSDVGHLVRAASGRAAVQIPPAEFRPRAYGADDDARWARAGVREAVMAGEAPPAGAWRESTAAGRFTWYVRRDTTAGSR
jgi:hypothetical protein